MNQVHFSANWLAIIRL